MYLKTLVKFCHRNLKLFNKNILQRLEVEFLAYASAHAESKPFIELQRAVSLKKLDPGPSFLL